MLERIKKKQETGFKEFVVSMESANSQNRVQILTTGILEDPLYMSYVVKNIKSFEDFLQLETSEITAVLTQQEQMIIHLARSICDFSEERISKFDLLPPRFFIKLKDELSYLKGQVPQGERESSRILILKTVRKLQLEERIVGFPWRLPPQHFYSSPIFKDGPFQQYFEDGILAVEGSYFKGKREGEWKHYYDRGMTFAEGDYLDGLKTGRWYFYYRDGKIRSEGLFVEDQKHGVWREWDRQGGLQEVNYVDGLKAS